MSETAVEEPIKAARRDSMDLGGASAPDRFGARPQTGPSVGSSLLGGIAQLGTTAAGINTAKEDSAAGDLQTIMGGANSLVPRIAIEHAIGVPALTMAKHAGIFTTAAARLGQQALGHDAGDVAHQTRDELGQSFGDLDATRAELKSHLAAKASGVASSSSPAKAVKDMTPEERESRIAELTKQNFGKQLGGKQLTPGAKLMRAMASTTIKSGRHGEEVQSHNHFAPTELTLADTGLMNGNIVTRNAEGHLVSKSDPNGVPTSSAAGKTAQMLNAPLQAIHAVGGALTGDTGAEALRNGNNVEAMARSGLGVAAAVGQGAAATAANASGAAGFGGVLAAGAAQVGGYALKGLSSAVGSATGVTEAANRQRVAELSENFYGPAGSRRAELMKGGMNLRPAADGINDEEAGMPSISFAKEGESFSEGAAAADKSLKESGWGEKGIWDSTKAGFHKGVNWGDKNLNSNHSVAGTVLRAGSGLIAGAGHGLSAMGSKIVRHVGKFAGGVGGAAAGAWSNIKGHASKYASGAWDKTKRGASWLGNKVASGASAAWGGMKSAAGWLGDKFSGASDWLKGKLLTSVHHDRTEKSEDSD
jgi:hypothetical protein